MPISLRRLSFLAFPFFHRSSSSFSVGFCSLLLVFTFLLFLCKYFVFEKMVGTGDLSVIFEENGRPKIAMVVPVYDLIMARHGTGPKPRFGAVNGPVEWKIPGENCRICDLVPISDSVSHASVY